MTTAVAKLHPDQDQITERREDSAAGHSPAHIGGFVCGGVLLATVISTITAPLTLPWIVTAWIATLTVVGTPFLANRQ